MDKDTDYKKIRETHKIEGTRQKKIRRRRIKYFLLILLICGSFFYLCYKYLFRINSVEYIGNEYYSSEILSGVFDVKSGDRLFSFSKTKKEEELLEKFPYLAECEITRTVPDKVTVTVKERQSKMYTLVLGKYIVFDEEMYVVEILDKKPSGLFEVKFSDKILVKCVLGEPLGFNDEKTGKGIAKVYEAVSSSAIFEKIQSMTLESRFDYYLDYEGKYKVYLGDSGESNAKLLFLEGIIEKLSDDSKGNIDVSNPKEGFFKETK